MNNNFYAPVRNSRHGGVVSLANDGATTVSGTAGVSQASVGVKIHSGVFDISKLAIDASKSNRMAVGPALQYQAETLASDFARAINRQMYSDGVGILAEVQATGTTSVIAQYPTGTGAGTADTRSVDWYPASVNNNDVSALKYIAPGAHITMGSGGLTVGTVSSLGQIAGSNAGTVTFTTGVIGTASQPFYQMDGSGNATGTSEIQGIRAALSSGTSYASLARTTTGWTPQLGTVNEALNLSRMESSYLAAKEFGQINDQYIILVNKTLYKKYGDLLNSLRRTVNETDLLGGWTGLEFAAGAGRVGVFLDYDVPDGEVLILDLDTFTICQVSDLDWKNGPGEGALLSVANTITYQATMVWFANLLCLAPAANGRETQKTA